MLRPTQFPSLAPIREYTTRYGGFRGVDYVSDPQLVDGTRSPEAINLMTDAGGYPEKRPGWRVIRTLDAPVNGLHPFTDSGGNQFILAHCNTKLYKITAAMDTGGAGDPAIISSGLANAKSWSFVHGNYLYLLDGSNYYRYNGTTFEAVESAADVYVPTVAVGAPPEGGGVAFEAVNMLTPKRKMSFVGDDGIAQAEVLQISTGAKAAGSIGIQLGGTTFTVALAANDTVAAIVDKIYAATFTGWSKVKSGDTITFTATAKSEKAAPLFEPNDTGVIGYVITYTRGANPKSVYNLGVKPIDSVAGVSVDGTVKTAGTHYTVQAADGTVTFTAGNIPAAGNGVDNVVITFSKEVSGYADRVKKCRFGAWFGSGNNTRLFLAGNPDYPNWDFMSGLMDPTYFPDTGYTQIGAKNSAIMGYLRQYSNLLIVKADNGQDATVYLRAADYDADGKPIFPLKQGVEGVGAVSSHCFASLRDAPLFLAKEGVFSLALSYGGVDQQRVAQSRSYYVNPKLVRELNLKDAAACVWDGLYMLAVNNRCYVADGRKVTGMSRTEERGYEWFFWDNIPARVWAVRDDNCYFGTSDGRVCRFNSDMERLERFNDGGTFTKVASVMQYNNDGKAIAALWATKVDDDGDFMRYKNLPRRGSGLLIKPYSQSSVDVYVVNDENQKTLSTSDWATIFDFGAIDFARFSFVTSKNPVVVPLSSPIRRYKTLQIVARNKEPSQGFGLFGIIKRFTVSDYVR
jgi:hypothetical protein